MYSSHLLNYFMTLIQSVLINVMAFVQHVLPSVLLALILPLQQRPCAVQETVILAQVMR